MNKRQLAGSAIFAGGCLLLAVGLTAVAVSPGGLGFFETAEVTKGWPYEHLQVSGLVLIILGVVTTLICIVAVIPGLLGYLPKRE